MNKYIIAIVIAFSSVGIASAMSRLNREFSTLERQVKAAEALRPSSPSVDVTSQINGLTDKMVRRVSRAQNSELQAKRDRLQKNRASFRQNGQLGAERAQLAQQALAYQKSQDELQAAVTQKVLVSSDIGFYSQSPTGSIDAGTALLEVEADLAAQKGLAPKTSSSNNVKKPWYMCCSFSSEPTYKVTVVQPAPAVPASAQNTARSNASDLNTARRSSASVTPSVPAIPKLNLNALFSE